MFLPGQLSPNQEQGRNPVPSLKGRQSLSRDQGIQRLVTPVTLTHKTIPPKYKENNPLCEGDGDDSVSPLTFDVSWTSPGSPYEEGIAPSEGD